METIVAISTAPGIGGIGIIRMSGKECFAILSKIFIPKNPREPQGYQIKYGNIINPKTKEILDEVLVSYFFAPSSYTKENMCEINSHGSTIIMKAILELCLENGAILAEPGEFTKRAFLNGRIDLSQAESIIDVINAKSKRESQASIKQLKGILSTEIREIRQNIIEVMVDIEAAIDYPEYDIEEVTNQKVLGVLEKSQKDLNQLKDSFDNGKWIKEGIVTAIIGKPNAGKSSLLNVILREERAIVSNIEGTTRDTIEEFVTLHGIPLKIIDTAGIRQAKDEIEEIGIQKAKKTGEEADLIIAIFDASKPLTTEDEEILEMIKEKKAIIVWNKTDLTIQLEEQEFVEAGKEILKISVKENKGIEKLGKKIEEMFELNSINFDNEVIVTNVRHKNLMIQALESVEKAKQAIQSEMPIDIVAIDLKNILESLGSITGENVSENIIKEIFSKFCLGK